MIGAVVERRYGQGADAPRGRPGVAMRLRAVEFGSAQELDEWLEESPGERVIVSVLACDGRLLVLYRDQEPG